jgi:hypothetical protein
MLDYYGIGTNPLYDDRAAAILYDIINKIPDSRILMCVAGQAAVCEHYTVPYSTVIYIFIIRLIFLVLWSLYGFPHLVYIRNQNLLSYQTKYSPNYYTATLTNTSITPY